MPFAGSPRPDPRQIDLRPVPPLIAPTEGQGSCRPKPRPAGSPVARRGIHSAGCGQLLRQHRGRCRRCSSRGGRMLWDGRSCGREQLLRYGCCGRGRRGCRGRVLRMTTASPGPLCRWRPPRVPRSAAAPGGAEQIAGAASADRMVATVHALAADRFAGRRVGTAGGQAAAQWLADGCASSARPSRRTSSRSVVCGNCRQRRS